MDGTVATEPTGAAASRGAAEEPGRRRLLPPRLWHRWLVHRAHLASLKLYARLPVWLRRSVVRRMGPSYTVGSLVLVEEGERVLLLRPSYRRAWGLPGGLLQRGESPADGAVREAREELGVDVRLVGRATLVVDLGPRRIDFVHRAELADPAARPWPASPEVAALEWFERSALPELLFEAETALAALGRPEEVPLVVPPGVRSHWLD